MNDKKNTYRYIAMLNLLLFCLILRFCASVSIQYTDEVLLYATCSSNYYYTSLYQICMACPQGMLNDNSNVDFDGNSLKCTCPTGQYRIPKDCSTVSLTLF